MNAKFRAVYRVDYAITNVRESAAKIVHRVPSSARDDAFTAVVEITGAETRVHRVQNRANGDVPITSAVDRATIPATVLRAMPNAFEFCPDAGTLAWVCAANHARRSARSVTSTFSSSWRI